ncbi:MAG TPA: hypothetical protein VF412_19140 [Bdellovibrio sp.]|uniref:hypothetical protein n=1 Tax=Bdellovibrio sp. TaxID=28201 RepID=UPI002EDD2600
MKTLWAILALIALALPALADEEIQRTTYVSGNGQYSAYCTANDMFCSHNVQQYAERQGIQDAETRCEINQGTPLTYTATCNTFCTPAYIPPGTSTWVSCRADCRMQCDVKD